MMRAIEETGHSLEDWERLCAPRPKGRHSGSRRNVEREGDGDGPLIGETIVFTGDFSVDKYDLADMAHAAGAAVRKRATRETTMIVIGHMDPAVVGETGKSSNLRYAEALAAKGKPILFVLEDDFRELVRGPGGL